MFALLNIGTNHIVEGTQNHRLMLSATVLGAYHHRPRCGLLISTINKTPVQVPVKEHVCGMSY